jgi:restriction system protein
MLIMFGGLILVALILLTLIHFQSHRRLRALKISDIDNMDGIEFENYVVGLLNHHGYHSIQTTKRSNDFGADIIAKKGKDKYSIQLKRLSHTVDRSAVSDAVGAMAFYGCNKSMVITTNYFTKSAKAFAQLHHCKLIDRDQLLSLIVSYQK